MNKFENVRVLYAELVSLLRAILLNRKDPRQAMKAMRSLKHLQIQKVGKSVLPFYKTSFINTLQRVVLWFFLLNFSIFIFFNFCNISDLRGSFVFLFCYFILYILSCVTTYTVLRSFNYIVSIVYLIFLFSLTGLVLMFCGVNFVGLTLIAVYVGGVLLLFLSVIKFLGFRAGDSMYLSDFYTGLIRGLLAVSKLLCLFLTIFVLFYFFSKTGPTFLNIILSE
jgi:NADH:ubiquinone oxidoreductase subunit 6 (subunit J)